MSSAGKQRGFTLVELMIAAALGLFLTTGVLTLFMTTLKSNSELANTQQLENELNASLGLMTRDLLRAGQNGKPSVAPNITNPFGLGVTGAYAGETANSCVLFSYDLNNDGVLGITSPGDERFGYRLRRGVVQTRRAGLSCTDDSWTDITTAGVVSVTQLQFIVRTLVDRDITMKQVTISLGGRLNNNVNVARSLTSTVRVRNDVWVPQP